MKSNMKEQLCNELIEKGIKENSVIRHSYTSNRLNNGEKNMGRVQSQDRDLCPTLDTRCDCLGIATKTYKNYVTWKNNKGEFNTECNRASLPDKLSLTLATNDMAKVVENSGGNSIIRIRKLTPTTCMKLMGFTKEDVAAMRQAGMSDMQIYHCAGDSIVTTVLMGIFGEMSETDYHKKIENYVERIVNEN